MATAKKTATRLTIKKLVEDMPTKELKKMRDYAQQMSYALNWTNSKAPNLSFYKELEKFSSLCLDELNNRNPNIRRK